MTRTGDVELITVQEAGGVEVGFSLLEEAAAPPKGSVFDWDPFWTDFPRAGSKKTLGSLAGSWAWTRPMSSGLAGALWQNTEFRFVGGLVVKS